MARHPRFCLPGYPQHVIQRGNNRDILFADDQDYRVYLEILGEASQRFGCAIHAYVCMTNHVHLLVTPIGESAISQTMQSLGRKYVQYFNHRYQRTGTLLEGRYKASLIDSDGYLLTCYRYIELNPVRAGMLEKPMRYSWSSHRYNAAGYTDSLVIEHPLYTQLGAGTEERRAAYRALFKRHISAKTLDNIRMATNKGWALGNDRFRQRIESLSKRQAAPKARGGDRRSEDFLRKQHGNTINRV